MNELQHTSYAGVSLSVSKNVCLTPQIIVLTETFGWCHVKYICQILKQLNLVVIKTSKVELTQVQPFEIILQ